MHPSYAAVFPTVRLWDGGAPPLPLVRLRGRRPAVSDRAGVPQVEPTAAGGVRGGGHAAHLCPHPHPEVRVPKVSGTANAVESGL